MIFTYNHISLLSTNFYNMSHVLRLPKCCLHAPIALSNTAKLLAFLAMKKRKRKKNGYVANLDYLEMFIKLNSLIKKFITRFDGVLYRLHSTDQ